MRVLIACYKPDAEPDILFVPELVAALSTLGVTVTWSSDEFWSPTKQYDIVHLQWPEAVFDWKVGGRYSVAALKWRLKCWKESGVGLVLTRHNENKHYASADFFYELYKVAEFSVDAIIHLGQYSQDQLLEEGCPAHIKHFVIPIHIFSSIDRSIGKTTARNSLRIPADKQFVLAFGSIRADEERILVMDVAKRLRKKGIYVFAPRLFNGKVFARPVTKALFELRRRLRFIKYGIDLHGYGPVSVRMMSCLFAASDVILIPRKRILNSGNLSMGFYFGKVVVGPDCGNVGEILKETGNPVFDPDDAESVSSAVSRGLDLAQSGKGLENKAIADARWRPDIVAKSLVAAYKQLLSACHEGISECRKFP